jgi:hypothetical protein
MYIVTSDITVKFTLELATKAQRGSRDIALIFLQPRHETGVGGQHHALSPIPFGMSRYPL